MPDPRCQRCAHRVPWLSFAGNLCLTIYKILVGILGGSSALVADGLHSGTDVIGTSMILFSRRVSGQPPDERHPFGHGKVEFMGSAFIYVVLLVLGVGIFFGAIVVIASGELQSPGIVTLLAAGVSVLYNVIMYRLGSCAGRKINSPALMANAFENRADAISSVAVVVGIAAATFIHPILDPIAAMCVGVIIGSNAVMELRKSIRGLTDTAMAPAAIGHITELALARPGVSGVDYVKTRQTGHGAWVDVGIRVTGEADVVEANAIARAVRREVMERCEGVDRVEVYVAAEPLRVGGRRAVPQE